VVHQTLLERNSAATVEHHYKPQSNVQNAAQKSKLELSSVLTVEQKSSNSHSQHFYLLFKPFVYCLVNSNFKREATHVLFSVTFLFVF
jgi:uracil DNA glycosylase